MAIIFPEQDSVYFWDFRILVWKCDDYWKFVRVSHYIHYRDFIGSRSSCVAL